MISEAIQPLGEAQGAKLHNGFPPCKTAGVCQIIGVLSLLGALGSVSTSMPAGVALLMTAIFWFIGGAVIQYIFDIKTLLMRADQANQNA